MGTDGGWNSSEAIGLPLHEEALGFEERASNAPCLYLNPSSGVIHLNPSLAVSNLKTRSRGPVHHHHGEGRPCTGEHPAAAASLGKPDCLSPHPLPCGGARCASPKRLWRSSDVLLSAKGVAFPSLAWCVGPYVYMAPSCIPVRY